MINIYPMLLLACLVLIPTQVLCLQNVTEIDETPELPLCSGLADTEGSFEVSYGYGSRTCKWARRTCTDEVCLIDEVSLNCPITCGVNCLSESGNVVRAEVNKAPVPDGQLKKRTTSIILWSLSMAGFVVTLAILLRRKQINTKVVKNGHLDDHPTEDKEVHVLSSKEMLHIWKNRGAEIVTLKNQKQSSSARDIETLSSRDGKKSWLPQAKWRDQQNTSSTADIDHIMNISEDDTDPCEMTMMESIDLEDASTGEGEQEMVLSRYLA